MKNKLITKGEFIIVYTVVNVLNFTIPFFLPSRVIGPYLFWIILPILTITYSVLIVERR